MELEYADKPENSFQLTAPLRLVSKNIRALMSVKLSEIGVEVGQDQLLYALPVEGSARIGGVANLLNIRASTVSKMVDRLVRDGLIQREPDASDLRKTNIALTPDGVEKRVRIETLLLEVERELIAGLGDNAGDVISILQRLDAILSRNLMRLR